MGIGKSFKKFTKNTGKFLTGRGKIGKWNIWAYPERYVFRKLRHKVGLTRSRLSRLLPRPPSSAASYGSSVSTGYLGSTGFRRMV